mgnify:CR=1 FL=1
MSSMKPLPPRIYVTEEDEENEQRLASLFQLRYEGLTGKNCVMKKESQMHKIDYSVWRDGSLVAWIEMRIRSNKMEKYPTIICSLDKYFYARQLHKELGTPVLFLVEWQGCGTVGFIDFNDVKADDKKTLFYQGANYRNDMRDIGTCIQIPVNDFTIIQHGAKTN